MTNFEDIQSIWYQQAPAEAPVPVSQLIEKAMAAQQSIRNKHRYTILILSVTITLLLLYFFYFARGLANRPLDGMVLMVVSIAVRVLAELVSYRRFNQLNPAGTLAAYTKTVAGFLQFRKKIQLLLTPVCMGLYGLGFVWLLPAVKKSVSTGFYWYIVISGLLFFALITLVIIKQVKKELGLLQYLGRIDKQ
jgi:hypothetical protein